MRLQQYLTELGNKKVNIQVTKNMPRMFRTVTDISTDDTDVIEVLFYANITDPDDILEHLNYFELSTILNLPYYEMPENYDNDNKESRVAMRNHEQSMHILEREFRTSEIWHIEFMRSVNGDATHKEQKNLPTEQVTSTYAAVKQSVELLIKAKKPDFLYFTGKRAESARIKLYDRIKINGYKLVKTFNNEMGRNDIDKAYLFKRI